MKPFPLSYSFANKKNNLSRDLTGLAQDQRVTQDRSPVLLLNGSSLAG